MSNQSFKLPIPDYGLVIMGKHSSGHNDNSNLKHSVTNTNDEIRGVVVGIDVAVNPNKVEGENWLKSLKERNKKMSVDEWKKEVRAQGSEKVMKAAKKDLYIRVVNVADPDEIRKDVIEMLVKLQTDEGDPLMPLHFENGDSCSTGGYSQRAESLLCRIPFFKNFYKIVNRSFDIKQTWCRASVEGTHDKHSDSFSRGATHRIILSINSYGKEMHFSY
mmetsp:Transcript_1602/g.2389  ORF Transcript_1602/g.2389 Transcript_1602/m.2389 type:complete len:218 (+) Transcript_1602:84-737(+)|eukprot:scaffold219_cov119-Skeletonema_dohrnii-CCMP3373.AAC.9